MSAELVPQARRQEPLLLRLGECLRAAPEDRLAGGAAPEILDLAPVPVPSSGRDARRPAASAARGTGRSSPALEVEQRAAMTDSPRTARRRPRRPGHDDAVVARELRDVVDGHADRIGDRLVLELHHRRQEVEQVVLASARRSWWSAPTLSAIMPRVVELVLVRVVVGRRSRSRTSSPAASRPRRTAPRSCSSRCRPTGTRPTGTSLTLRRRTACAARRARARRSRPRSRRRAGRRAPRRPSSAALVIVPSSVTRSQVPPASFLIPPNSVCGAGVVRNDR